MTREEYYKQRSKERFKRFCKWLDLHFYVELKGWITLIPSKLLKNGDWEINYKYLQLNYKCELSHFNVLIVNSNVVDKQMNLKPTTVRRVLLEGCSRLNNLSIKN